jgi:hypothetical protein
MLAKITLSVLSIWFALTAFIDLYLIPTVFRYLNDIFLAGRLGLKLFTFFNYFEMLFALVLMLTLVLSNSLNWKRLQLALSGALLAIASLYTFYLSTKIDKLTDVMMSAQGEALKLVQADHNFFHNLYVRTDIIKLVILLVLLIMAFKGSKEKRIGL